MPARDLRPDSAARWQEAAPFRRFVEETDDLMTVVDAEGVFVYVNPASERVLGVPPAACVGRSAFDFVHPDDRERTRAAFRDWIEQPASSSFAFENRQVTSDGEVLDLHWRVTVLGGEGEPIQLASIARDVTELRRAQRRETAVLRSLAAIGESTSVIAHEIKNPITAVNMALRAVASTLGEDERSVIEDLVARLQRVERMIHGSLSFARPLEVRPSAVSADALLRGAATSVAPELARAGVALDVEVAAGCSDVLVERERIEDALANLLRNACEALQRGGRIALSAAPDGDGRVALAVEDDGPGIPASARERVFRPFETTRDEGTGLGLAIARKLVEAHGGTLEIEEGALGGARFVARIPAAGAAALS